MVQANYLEKTAPQIKVPFIKTLHQIPLLSNLDKSTLESLFGYSRFVNLNAGQTLFQQGSFDQSVYFLISGTIEVLIQNKDSKVQKIDTFNKPFSLIGERSILGEPQGITPQASEPSLLLGVDMSLLPDVLDFFDNQDKLQASDTFSENISLYTVLGHVLAQRVDRLIKDQYKLAQKVNRLNETAKSWKTNELIALIFNEFVENRLPEALRAKAIVNKVLIYYRVQSPRIAAILKGDFNTARLYIELVSLKAAGKIGDLEKLIFTIVKQLTAHALKGEIYASEMAHAPKKLSPLISLSDVLVDFYNEIKESKILNVELSMETFLKETVGPHGVSISKLIKFVSASSLVDHHFGRAYLLFLFCKSHLNFEEQLNKRIQERISALSNLGRSKQDTRLAELEDNMKVAIKNLKKMASITK